MRLYTAEKDYTDTVTGLKWSGDTREVARKISFSLPGDIKLPAEGDGIYMSKDNGKELFYGILLEVEKSGSEKTVSYLSYDLMFYINKSQVNRVFSGSPENVVRTVCRDLDVPCGDCAVTGMSVYFPCLGKTGYDAIMTAYTLASRKNGKKYMPLIKNTDKVCVIEKGTDCGVKLDGYKNLTGTNYKSSLLDMVNRVVITDNNGNVIGSVQDADSRNKYGTVQNVYKQQESVDSQTAAKKMLKNFTRSASAEGLGDFRAISGYSLLVYENISGLYGRFYIESDEHSFENGVHTMTLTLDYELMMDEVEAEKVEQ